MELTPGNQKPRGGPLGLTISRRNVLQGTA